MFEGRAYLVTVPEHMAPGAFLGEFATQFLVASMTLHRFFPGGVVLQEHISKLVEAGKRRSESLWRVGSWGQTLESRGIIGLG